MDKRPGAYIIHTGNGEWEVCEGDLVLDDLTGKEAKILKIVLTSMHHKIIIDSDYLGGDRYPWEISEIRRR